VRHGERIERSQFPEGYGTMVWFYLYYEYFSDCDEQFPGGFHCEYVMWVWVQSVVVANTTLYKEKFVDWENYHEDCGCTWCAFHLA
jgi:hypothetical protein